MIDTLGNCNTYFMIHDQMTVYPQMRNDCQSMVGIEWCLMTVMGLSLQFGYKHSNFLCVVMNQHKTWLIFLQLYIKFNHNDLSRCIFGVHYAFPYLLNTCLLLLSLLLRSSISIYASLFCWRLFPQMSLDPAKTAIDISYANSQMNMYILSICSLVNLIHFTN